MDLDEDVYIVPYNNLWPEQFRQEKERLKKNLCQHFVELEHIGSSAVPELSAKPVIDIMVGVKEYPPSDALINQICSLGYFFHGEASVPGRLYFTLRGSLNFNLAVVLFQGEHWRTNIKFRNHLRNHPHSRREYEKVKKAAIACGASKLLAYSEYKKQCIANILKNL